MSKTDVDANEHREKELNHQNEMRERWIRWRIYKDVEQRAPNIPRNFNGKKLKYGTVDEKRSGTS